MSRKCLLIDSNMLWGKAQGLKEDFNMGSPETSDTKPFTASKGWLRRFGNRFGPENIKITRETFLAELKKLIKERGFHPKQIFN